MAVLAVSTPREHTALADGSIAFVDVETTGGDARFDRIIEVGIVSACGGVREGEWSTLVNPERWIPSHIEALTGISNEMVEGAPTFAEVAREIEARLDGRLFVAHNAGFDRSFIRAELRRAERKFSPRSLCTVRLSRRFFPEAESHALDSVIQRLGCAVERRHRALDDARVLWELWQAIARRHPPEVLEQVLCELVALTTLPPQLPADLADELPEGPGVYRFYGEQRALLYVGQSRSIRSRVLSHFNSAHRSRTDRQLKTEVRDIEWTETAGALGAEIAEIRCIRESQPAYNRRLTHSRTAFTVRLIERDDGGVHARVEELDPGEPIGEGYGLHRMRSQAVRHLARLVREHALCAVALGLEQSAGSCVGYQLSRCRGVCVGKESRALHATRARLAFAPERMREWPFRAAIGVRERSLAGGIDMHVFHDWRYLGTAHDDDELTRLLSRSREAQFDLDVYRILGRYLRGKRRRFELVDLKPP
jgi:DNA polymerase-3 subunit epsilon